MSVFVNLRLKKNNIARGNATQCIVCIACNDHVSSSFKLMSPRPLVGVGENNHLRWLYVGQRSCP